MIFLIFCFHFHFVHLGKAENAFSLSTILRGSIKLAMLILKLIKKWGSWCALNNALDSYMHLLFSQKLSNKDKRKRWKKKKTKKLATWNPSLHFGSPNHVLSFELFFSLFQTNWFSLQNDAMQAKSKFDLSLSWTFV
jgi:hypothetical protein